MRTIAAKLGRTWQSVGSKAALLGLSWPLEFRAWENVGGKTKLTAHQQAEALSRVQKKATLHGRSHVTSTCAIRLSCGWYAENGGTARPTHRVYSSLSARLGAYISTELPVPQCSSTSFSRAANFSSVLPHGFSGAQADRTIAPQRTSAEVRFGRWHSGRTTRHIHGVGARLVRGQVGNLQGAAG